MEIPQLQFDKVFSFLLCRLCSSTGAGQLVARPDVGDIPVMAQRQDPLVVTVQADHGDSQLQFIDKVVYVPVVQFQQDS